MYVEFENRVVKKTRKPHRCEWCDELMPAGSTTHYRAYIWEDGPQSGWMHPECWEAMGECDSGDLAQGWMPGDYARGSTE